MIDVITVIYYNFLIGGSGRHHKILNAYLGLQSGANAALVATDVFEKYGLVKDITPV